MICYLLMADQHDILSQPAVMRVYVDGVCSGVVLAHWARAGPHRMCMCYEYALAAIESHRVSCAAVTTKSVNGVGAWSSCGTLGHCVQPITWTNTCVQCGMLCFCSGAPQRCWLVAALNPNDVIAMGVGGGRLRSSGKHY